MGWSCPSNVILKVFTERASLQLRGRKLPNMSYCLPPPLLDTAECTALDIPLSSDLSGVTKMLLMIKQISIFSFKINQLLEVERVRYVRKNARIDM